MLSLQSEDVAGVTRMGHERAEIGHAAWPARPLASAERAGWQDRGAWGLVAVFSAVVNILMLTGPIFMLQVYDRVLPSGSGATLAALFALVCGLYAAMAVLDAVRLYLVADLGARVQARLDTAITWPGAAASPAQPGDVDALRRACAAPGCVALFDVAWTPLFLLVLFGLHPWLGWVALGGCAVLGVAALAHQRAASVAAQAGAQALARAAHLFEVAAAHSPAAPPPRGWAAARAQAGHAALRAGRAAAIHIGLTRGFRLFLQSAVLALGAWLVLRGEATAGAVLAAAILAARALVPVEQAAAHIPLLLEARAARVRIGAAPVAGPEGDAPGRRGPAIRPAGAADRALRISGLAVALPGMTRPALQGICLTLEPGSALGVIGPQGAGKSLLLGALAGSVPLAAGSVLWGGWAGVGLAPPGHVAILPQRVDLIAGSLAANIALGRAVAPAAVLRAVRSAGLDGLVAALPQGLETPVGPGARPLSAGETARLGLARVLVRRPRLVLLDDPFACLDADGAAALHATVRRLRADGVIVVLTAHRPSSVATCDRILVLESGRMAAHGPSDAVLQALSSQRGAGTGAGALGADRPVAIGPEGA